MPIEASCSHPPHLEKITPLHIKAVENRDLRQITLEKNVIGQQVYTTSQ
jgi:hypothetical protein